MSSKRRSWEVQREFCGYCGRAFAVNNLRRHAAICWENPEYKQHLRASLPATMSASEYEKSFAALGCPALSRIRSSFGTWRKFLAWLFGAQDVVDQIEEEMRNYRNELRRGREGIQVFDRPRRTWTVNGRTFQSWGVR